MWEILGAFTEKQCSRSVLVFIMEELEKSTDTRRGAGEILKSSATASLQSKKSQDKWRHRHSVAGKGQQPHPSRPSVFPPDLCQAFFHSPLAFPVSSLHAHFPLPIKSQVQLIAEFVLEARSLDPFPKIFLLHHPSNPDFPGSQAISLSRSLSQFSSLFCFYSNFTHPCVLASFTVFIIQLIPLSSFPTAPSYPVPRTVAGTEHTRNNIL